MWERGNESTEQNKSRRITMNITEWCYSVRIAHGPHSIGSPSTSLPASAAAFRERTVSGDRMGTVLPHALGSHQRNARKRQTRCNYRLIEPKEPYLGLPSTSPCKFLGKKGSRAEWTCGSVDESSLPLGVRSRNILNVATGLGSGWCTSTSYNFRRTFSK